VNILIKKATIIDATSKHHLKKKDILIVNGIIEKIDSNIIADKKTSIIEHTNMYVSSGWTDVFCNFADPGYEHKETLQTGIDAAIGGGFCNIMLVPNTKPAISTKAMVQYIKSNTANSIVNILPIGAATKDAQGDTLAEMMDMQNSGAIAFSDGYNSIQNSAIMLKALQYVKAFDGQIIQLPVDKNIANNGLMHEGITSTQLGMQGQSHITEDIAIARDIELLRYSKSKLHLTGISTANGVALIKKAKKEGLPITCSTTVYHLLFTEQALIHYDSNYKINPPLRTAADRKALLKGLTDGTIDCISTHHNPQDWDSKNIEFEYAQPGIAGLETCLHALLSIANSSINIATFIAALSTNPKKIFGINNPSIEIGNEASVTIFTTNSGQQFTEQNKKTKAINNPFLGEQLLGQILGIINNFQAHIN
jgi:dihydroorotase